MVSRQRRNSRNWKRYAYVEEISRKEVDILSNMPTYLSKIVYDVEFVFAEAKSINREKIISRKKKLTSNDSSRHSVNSIFVDPDYAPKVNGPPIEMNVAINLFSIAHWNKAEKQLSRKKRSDKCEVVNSLKNMWKSLSQSDRKIWKKLEKIDRKRYLYERKLYFKSLARGKDNNRSLRYRKSSRRSPGRMTHETKSPIQSKRKHHEMNVDKQCYTKLFILYQYCGEGNIFPMQQVEMRNDRKCPICLKECFSDDRLMLHCKIAHNDIIVKGAKDQAENLYLAICIDPGRPSCFRRSQHLGSFSFARSKSWPIPHNDIIPLINTSQQQDKVEKPSKKRKGTQIKGNKTVDSSSIQVIEDNKPKRQYYRSRTFAPMIENEWDIDSDDYSDDEWIHEESKELISEFKDVSEKEKKFMILWNRYIKSHTVISDHSLSQRCAHFIRLNIDKLVETDLRSTLLLHICNLWDEGLLSSYHILDLIATYDRLKNCIDMVTAT